VQIELGKKIQARALVQGDTLSIAIGQAIFGNPNSNSLHDRQHIYQNSRKTSHYG